MSRREMGFIYKGDQAMEAIWKRERQLRKLPAQVRANMSAEDVRNFLQQDVDDGIDKILEKMRAKLAAQERDSGPRE